MARRAFGLSAEMHHQSAKDRLREIRRLTRVLRDELKNPPDCERAAGVAIRLAQEQGAYLIDRFHGRSSVRRSGQHQFAPPSYGGRGPRGAIRRFEQVCIVKPRSPAAARKMRAVWRRAT